MALVRVSSLADAPHEGEVGVFEVEGRSLCVANVAGELFAIDNICTHDGGPLGEGSLWQGQVECPRHGARFDLKTGRPVTLPAVTPVKTYEVQVEGDEVKVEL
jgi:3-phenylpropionate/trans-cinnamate dioxygenase ferredoxin component